MNEAEIVFSCNSCRKPLVVESFLVGKHVNCPLCGADIVVPTVKAGILRGSRNSPAARVSQQMRQIKRLGERLSVLEESLLSAERGAPEMGENFDQLIAQSKLMQQELHLVRKHLETSSPGEALPENNSANVVEFPYGSAWGWVGYGLAALFALLMLLT